MECRQGRRCSAGWSFNVGEQLFHGGHASDPGEEWSLWDRVKMEEKGDGGGREVVRVWLKMEEKVGGGEREVREGGVRFSGVEAGQAVFQGWSFNVGEQLFHGSHASGGNHGEVMGRGSRGGEWSVWDGVEMGEEEGGGEGEVGRVGVRFPVG